MVHSNGNVDPSALISALQNRFWSIDRNQPSTVAATLHQHVGEVNARTRSQTTLLGIFAVRGFLLALMGVYGVIAYLVGLQIREIGIRMALGAAPAQLLGLVLAHGLKAILAGVAIGLIAGLALARFLSKLLFGISSSDPLTYVTVSPLLIALIVARIYLPTHHASRIGPILALHYE
jgi:putative ABC transport system permease protein